MTLPLTLLRTGPARTYARVMGHVTLFHVDSFTAIQRAPDSGGSPDTGNALIVNVLHPGVASFEDLIARDGITQWYRARHEKPGFTPSDWTAWVSATPDDTAAPTARDLASSLGISVIKRPGVLKADVGVVDSGTIKVVTAAGAASSITKTLRIHHAEFVAQSNNRTWIYGAIQVQPNAAGETVQFHAPVVLPKGVTITGIRVRHFRQNSTGDIATMQLFRVASDAATDISGTVTHNSTGWLTQTASFTQLVGDEAYTAISVLRGDAQAADARLQFLEIDYTVPSYDKSY